MKGTSPDEGNAETVCLQREATSCFNHKVGACQAHSRAEIDEMLQVQEDNDKSNAIQRHAAAERNASHSLCIKSRATDDRRLMEACQQARKMRPQKAEAPETGKNKKKEKISCPNLVYSHHYILAWSHRGGQGR